VRSWTVFEVLLARRDTCGGDKCAGSNIIRGGGGWSSGQYGPVSPLFIIIRQKWVWQWQIEGGRLPMPLHPSLPELPGISWLWSFVFVKMEINPRDSQNNPDWVIAPSASLMGNSWIPSVMRMMTRMRGDKLMVMVTKSFQQGTHPPIYSAFSFSLLQQMRTARRVEINLCINKLLQIFPRGDLTVYKKPFDIFRYNRTFSPFPNDKLTNY